MTSFPKQFQELISNNKQVGVEPNLQISSKIWQQRTSTRQILSRRGTNKKVETTNTRRKFHALDSCF